MRAVHAQLKKELRGEKLSVEWLRLLNKNSMELFQAGDLSELENDEDQSPHLTTKTEKNDQYADVEELKAIIRQLRGKKFKLECGHRVTFGYFLGNDILIRNGKEPTIICSDCA
jgi:hypothetical protein